MADINRCCRHCLPCKKSDFKEVVNLKTSGLLIYLHTGKDDKTNVVVGRNEGSIVIHNSNNRVLNKTDYVNELCRYETSCCQCKKIFQTIRSLLNEIVVIKENQVIGICAHCKKATTTKQCRKCDYIVTKFLAENQKKNEDRQKRFKQWLLNVKHLLQTILNAHGLCKQMVYKDNELERILKELNVSTRMPDIECCPNIQKDQSLTQSITETKEMFEELWNKIHGGGLKKGLPSYVSLTSLSKLLKEGNLLQSEMLASANEVAQGFQKEEMADFQNFTRNLESERSATASKLKFKPIFTSIAESGTNAESESKTQSGPTFTRKTRAGISTKSELEMQPKQKFTNKLKVTLKSDPNIRSEKKYIGKSKTKPLNVKISSNRQSTLTIEKLMEQSKKKKEKDYDLKDKNEIFVKKELKEASDLVMPESVVSQAVVSEQSLGFVEEMVPSHTPKYIVKGIYVKPYVTHQKREQDPKAQHPILFNKLYLDEHEEGSVTVPEKEITKDRGKDGIIRYKLSDRQFIDNGWTQLPTEKVLRQIVNMTIGKIGEFKVPSDDWKLYVDRLENYFVVNDIKEELRVATLITVMGAESYELLVNLCTPHKPGGVHSI